jgi:hypothetical protein
MMAKPESMLEASRDDIERLMADANALDRLASTEEWKVMDRLLGEHVSRLLLALRQRGLGFAETDALRAEIEAVEWLRYRPIALRRAVTEHEAMEEARLKSQKVKYEP